MEIKLSQLYNTLCLVEVKGESAKHMGLCLTFLEKLIEEAKLKSALDGASKESEENHVE